MAQQGTKSLWAFNLCNIRGIPIRIHASFLLLLAWVGLDEASAGGSPLTEVTFVLLVFLCVLLHELAHALVALRYRIRTRSIVLFPFGGVATLADAVPPRPELFIAIAGPILNLVLAALLYAFLPDGALDLTSDDPDVLTRLFATNIALAVFNLIPAFPMDGGRILRSCMVMWGVKNATPRAARVGQIISVMLAGLAIAYELPILFLIAVVVFYGAVQERVQQRVAVAVDGFSVSDVMIGASHLVVFPHGMRLRAALDAAVRAQQDIFPVQHGDAIIGTVSRSDLYRAAADGEVDSYVSAVMNREFPSVSPGQDLRSALQIMGAPGQDDLLVLENGGLCGMLLRSRVMEFLLVSELSERNRRARETEST